jgi:hypothetical protein
MTDDLQQGIAALRAGDKVEARRLIGRVIRQNPRNAHAWLWLSGAVETDQERLTCLNKVLALNPENKAAQRGVTALQKRVPVTSPAPIETQPVPQPRASLVQSVLGTDPAATARFPTLDPPEAEAAAAAYPYAKVSDMLDHSKSLDELEPEKRQALEGFVPLIAQDLTVNHMRPEEIIDRISARGFSRKAVEQIVGEVAQQPIRTPVRYEQKLTQEQFESLPSPWFTMWTRPRETMRRIVYYDPKRDVLLLAVLQGFIAYLSGALYGFLLLVLISNDYVQAPGTWESDLSALPSTSFTALAAALGTCAVVGPIAGLIGLYLYGWLFRVTGRWLGGNAYPIEVRAALAWSAVPQIWGAILQVLKLVMVVYVLYANATNTYVSSSALLSTLGAFLLLESVIGIWSLVLTLQSLGEVHSFSALRALGAVLLAGVIVFVVSIVLSCVLNVIASAFISALLGASGS